VQPANHAVYPELSSSRDQVSSIRFVPPLWALVPAETGVVIQGVDGRLRLALDGELAGLVERDPAAAADRLASLSILDPRLSEVADALRAHAPRAWNRANLLRGIGWDTIFLELTARCNEACAHCYASSHPERDEALPRETILEVIDAAARMGFRRVQLTGGDPLVSAHCAEAAERARALGIPEIEVYTNGLALHGETFDRLARANASFAFSFYSHREEAHDAITRRPGSHARTTSAIDRAVKAKLAVRASIVVLEQNAGDVAETRALLSRLGVETIGVDYVRAVGRGLEEHDPSLADAAFTGLDHAGRGEGAAGWGGKIAVRADGAVVPCIFDRDLVLGSVLEASLDSILDAEVEIPPPAVASPEAVDRAAERLACYDCRLVSIALGGALGPRGPRRLEVLR
jgi:MoaA/NifB/PqqE/SkfB family radical SAM enzyme